MKEAEEERERRKANIEKEDSNKKRNNKRKKKKNKRNRRRKAEKKREDKTRKQQETKTMQIICLNQKIEVDHMLKPNKNIFCRSGGVGRSYAQIMKRGGRSYP